MGSLPEITEKLFVELCTFNCLISDSVLITDSMPKSALITKRLGPNKRPDGIFLN